MKHAKHLTDLHSETHTYIEAHIQYQQLEHSFVQKHVSKGHLKYMWGKPLAIWQKLSTTGADP